MKTNNLKLVSKVPLAGIVVLIIAGLCFMNVMGCQPDNDKNVMKAYELRMQGRVDDALMLIDSLLAVDTTNALAYFERSRILQHMMIGGADRNPEGIFTAINKAAMLDKNNVNINYQKAVASFLHAYMKLMRDEGDAIETVNKACDNFKYVLELQPGQPQALLYLVDIYSQLPPDLGGDKEQAEHYAGIMKHGDEYYAAKAELLINQEDELNFWLSYLESHNSTPELMEDIAAAYVYEEDPVNAEKYYNEAIALDPSRNYLILNMARYYMYQVMQDQSLSDSLLPIAASYVNKYLDSNPEPIIPMKAYALGMLAKTKMFSGDKEEGMELMDQAKKLDPYFSRASGLPGMSEFDPPDQIIPRYASFFRPF